MIFDSSDVKSIVALDVEPSFNELVEEVEGSADEETGRNISQRYNGWKKSIVIVFVGTSIEVSFVITEVGASGDTEP